MLQQETPSASEHTLHRLLQECQDQLQAFFNHGASAGESPSCNEIVTHAARGYEPALNTLAEMIIPLIRRRCSSDARIDIDDTVQDVSMRLVNRFRNQTNPYQVSTFAAFRSYLNLTIRSVVLNTIERDRQPNISVDHLADKQASAEPAESSATDVVNERIFLEDLLALLPDRLERESLRRRYLYQETPAEIAEALQKEDPTVTKAHVYRYVERGMRRLVNHPLVLKLQEEG